MIRASHARAVVSRSALITNARLVAQRVAPAELAVVVKDDAYAHGITEVVSALSGAGFHRFGALDLTTAREVRERAPEAMVFAWVFGEGDDIATAISTHIDLGVSYPSMLERVADVARRIDRRARVHLKIDTGLHRAGVLAGGWPDFLQRAAELQNEGVIDVTGIWTHIAEASYDADSAAIRRFDDAIRRAHSVGLRPRLRHLAASAASFERADARYDMVRVGAFVYGIAPGDGIGPEQLGLTPALTLSTTVSAVETVHNRTIARIPVGQVNGLYSDAEGVVDVAIRNRRYPFVRVTRTEAHIDLSGSGATVGDDVYLFGDGTHGESSLQVWADAMGSIGEEIVIRLARAAEHVYVE
ncbi:alanine racemase [Paramicrobacterium chengjingii]|uniref:Alanine racemase n=1 Tax=Paramicrobacterium chengjingii TaxID=2769067 RepID=A0ABX6YMG7_9MICO|nr:alanine racemase [Microbacterium chengjingii]QPZ40044.1 alanine racemase [Microbacterium chengjingii]